MTSDPSFGHQGHLLPPPPLARAAEGIGSSGDQPRPTLSSCPSKGKRLSGAGTGTLTRAKPQAACERLITPGGLPNGASSLCPPFPKLLGPGRVSGVGWGVVVKCVLQN